MPHLPLRKQTPDAPHGDGKRQSGKLGSPALPSATTLDIAFVFSSNDDGFVFREVGIGLVATSE
jgi:hypothetical protein